MSVYQAKIESELTKLSDSLIPSKEDLENGKKSAQQLFELLKTNRKYRIDRAGVFGSIEKQTSIKVDFDFDCAVFVNDVLPPYKSVKDVFEDVLTLAESGSLKPNVTEFSIGVKLNGVEFDIVPAANFSQNKKEQREQTLKRIRRLPRPAAEGYKYSSCLDETQVEFIKNQSDFAHRLIRLAKFWNKTLFVTEYISGRSSMFEIIALKAAIKEEENYNSVSILRAFRRFLESIKDLNNLKIIFEKYYSIKDVDDYILRQRPLVLDPSNPYNNFAYPFIQNEQLKRRFQEFATTTIDRLQNKVYGLLNFNPIFEPQPTVAPQDHVKESIPPFRNWLFTIKEEQSDKKPNLIVRNEKNVNRLGEKIIQHYLSKNIYIFNSDIRRKDEMESEVVKTVCQNIFNESTVRSLSSTDKRHEDYDITFEVPTKHFMVIVSIKWD